MEIWEEYYADAFSNLIDSEDPDTEGDVKTLLHNRIIRPALASAFRNERIRERLGNYEHHSIAIAFSQGDFDEFVSEKFKDAQEKREAKAVEQTKQLERFEKMTHIKDLRTYNIEKAAALEANIDDISKAKIGRTLGAYKTAGIRRGMRDFRELMNEND